MISRRDFLQAGMAASAIVGASGFGNWARLAAQQALTQDELLEFDAFGNVTLIHITDIHAQLTPIWFREPSVNIGVGENRGQGAARHRRRLPHALRDRGRQPLGLRADLRRLRGAGAGLRADGRDRPHRDRRQRDPRRPAGRAPP